MRRWNGWNRLSQIEDQKPVIDARTGAVVDVLVCRVGEWKTTLGNVD